MPATPDRILRQAYRAPSHSYSEDLLDLLARLGRDARNEGELFRDAYRNRATTVFCAGDLGILDQPAVSIVGTREVSEAGWGRAARLARDLANRGVTVVSGLAKGVDTAALTSATSNGGRVAAVIGTPLDKAYPSQNAELQQQIAARHLLITPFRVGQRVFRYNFPVRNRIMAAISDATVIIEASDTSGTLHQAAECVRLGRWLFIAKSMVENISLAWPDKFLEHPKTRVLASVDDLLSALANARPPVS